MGASSTLTHAQNAPVGPIVSSAHPRPPGGWRLVARAVFAYGVLAWALFRTFRDYSFSIGDGGEPWLAGDWFINYGGGFVRRGLFGELFLAVAPGGAAGLWLLFFIQMALYGLVLLWLGQVLHRTRYSWSAVAVACAPAGLAFIGWDLDGGFRKELIAFAVLVLLGWARSRRRGPVGAVALTVLALVLFFLAVFSWEASALLLPAVWYLLLGRGAPHAGLEVFRRSAAAVFTVVGGVGAVVSTLVHGDLGTAAAVCETVRAHGFLGPDLCGSEGTGGGGIEAIGWTSERAVNDVLVSFPLYVGYLPFVVLALVPVLVSRWFRSNWMWGVLVIVAVLPLFAVVTDYGRWVHIIVIALTICMTADDPDGVHSSLWNPVVTVIFVSLWGLPHHLAPDSGWPWLGLVRTVVDELIIQLGTVMGRW